MRADALYVHRALLRHPALEDLGKLSASSRPKKGFAALTFIIVKAG